MPFSGEDATWQSGPAHESISAPDEIADLGERAAYLSLKRRIARGTFTYPLKPEAIDRVYLGGGSLMELESNLSWTQVPLQSWQLPGQSHWRRTASIWRWRAPPAPEPDPDVPPTDVAPADSTDGSPGRHRDRTGRGNRPRTGGIANPSTGEVMGGGYLPDRVDSRDFGLDKAKEDSLLQNALKAYAMVNWPLGAKEGDLPEAVNLLLTGKFTPVESQGYLNSCTAQAIVGALEYLRHIQRKRPIDLSRRFLYKLGRRLAGHADDSGLAIRDGVKAAIAFGVPPESEFPYVVEQYNEEPEPFHYAYANHFKGFHYLRLDVANGTTDELLNHVKQVLACGLPVVFGFETYDSLGLMAGPNYVIPPRLGEFDGSHMPHAVLAVGYDNGIVEPLTNDEGALIIRNSWGPLWGDGGYGCLPYSYVTKGRSRDFWVIF
jgi:hypothetical protein